MVTNVHERVLQRHASDLEVLIDGLASDNDLLWPRDRWPRMRLDRPLSVGATGGHGPVRYFVDEYEPGRKVRFRFTEPRGFLGTHAFVLEMIGPDTTRLRHELFMHLRGRARISWPMMWRWGHDALIEDALDRAQAYASGNPVEPRAWPLWVHLVRRVAGRRRKKVTRTQTSAAERGRPRSWMPD